MQALQPQLPPQNQPLFVTNCHLKQYWPVWIYKGTLAGLAVGEYGLKRWEFTAGIAGVGLIAMYVLSYLLGKDDPIVIPTDVQEYQETNDQNIAALGVASHIIDEVEALAARQAQLLEEGRSSILQNKRVVTAEDKDLTEIRVDAQASESMLCDAMTHLHSTEHKVSDLMRAEQKDAHDLESNTQKLQEISAKGRSFLESRKQIN